MAKALFAVFGAAGNQGNSAANAVLDDPDLSQRYAVRAISRDISKPKMQALQSKGAELVQADLDDPASLPTALKGVDYLFFLTTTQYQGHSRDIETRQSHALCTEAVAQGVQYIIFSSMSHPFRISHGTLQHVEHFDAKAEIEQYIRRLPVKSAFFAPASFMQNVHSHLKPRPSAAADGSYAIANILPASTLIPYLDISDTGAWIGAILADPEKYAGSFFAAAEGFYTLDRVCEIISNVTGKTVRYHRLPDEEFKSVLPEPVREALYEMWVLIREYGYYGGDMAEQVGWAKAQARGTLTGFEAYLRREKYTLE